MRSRTIPILLVLLAVSLGLAGRFASAEEPGAQPLTETGNLLTNPSFEGEFTFRHDPYTGLWAGELGVADGWDLWYDNVQVCPLQARVRAMMPYYVSPACSPESYNRRPEYKAEEGTYTVRSGQKAQKYFTTYSTHTAGLWQRVSVPRNVWVSFSIWVRTWSSNLNDPLYSMEPGYYAVSVGIDPIGGSNWASKDIVWSKPITRHDRWVQLEVSAYTRSDVITVWTRGTQNWPVKHNDSYWDDARLVVLSGAPTATPLSTLTPTAAPTPQSTPIPDPAGSWRKWAQFWRVTGTDGVATWEYDAARGTVDVTSDTLWLRNGVDSGAFPLAWVDATWPSSGDLRLSLRFAFDEVTGYGTGIGVGSRTYDGERVLQAMPDNPHIKDILHVHHYAGGGDDPPYRVDLLGRTVWTGSAGDTRWHTLALELRGMTYILSIDGQEVGRAVSYWRPCSMFVGSPLAIGTPGRWSEVGVADVLLERTFDDLPLPLVIRSWAPPGPTLPVPETLPPPEG